MAKAKRKRWVCPECGTGKLGPGRPRRDDVVRYCLSCSEKRGRLVERYCPVRERKRAAKAEARKRKQQRKRKREQKKRQQWPNILHEHFARMKQLPCWRDDVRPATLHIRNGRGGGYFRVWSREIMLHTNASAEAVERDPTCAAPALAIMIHELAHAATVFEVEPHGPQWRSRHVEAVRELLGSDVDLVRPSRHRYSLEGKVTLAFQRAIASGAYPLHVEPRPKKRKREQQTDLPEGWIQFNVPGGVLCALYLEDDECRESFLAGLPESASKAFQNGTRRRQGRGTTLIIEASVEDARAIVERLQFCVPLSADLAAVNRVARTVRLRAAEKG